MTLLKFVELFSPLNSKANFKAMLSTAIWQIPILIASSVKKVKHKSIGIQSDASRTADPFCFHKCLCLVHTRKKFPKLNSSRTGLNLSQIRLKILLNMQSVYEEKVKFLLTNFSELNFCND